MSCNVRFIESFFCILAPLRALCSIQLAHGAEVHDSKQKALAEGTWSGDRPITNRNKINRERRLIEKYKPDELNWREWLRIVINCMFISERQTISKCPRQMCNFSILTLLLSAHETLATNLFCPCRYSFHS